MDWQCSECTYTNSSEEQICVMCEQGYRFFSMDYNQTSSQNIADDSTSMSNDENDTWGSETLSSTEIESKYDEDDSFLGVSSYRKDIYVREDGQILNGQQATDERKRSIARRKALDLQKAWGNSPYKLDPNAQESSSTFHTNVLKASASGVTTTYFASAGRGHFNALTARAKAANASATATAELAAASAANAYATGANASASASASAVRANVLNANATGVNTSVSATADGLKVAAGNVSVTGVEVAASTSVSAARIAVGNVDVTGASAGASANVNGAGVSAFNVAVGGPSAAASVNVDGSLSFGNVNLGLRPSLDIGWGLNIGIPFLSGSRMGSGGGGGANNKNGNSNDGQPNNQESRGLEGCQQYLSEKFPNQRHYLKAAEFSIDPNTAKTSIDPTLTDKRLERDNGDDPVVDSVVERHNALVDEGKMFVGYKGGPKRVNAGDGQASSQSSAPSTDNGASSTSINPSSNQGWSGLYTSPSPAVAAGYAMDDKGRPGEISRVYIEQGAGGTYYTATGLNTREGSAALRDVQKHSNGRYVFSGPQHDTDPDLRAPETVISPAVRDEAFKTETIKFEGSAHELNPNSYRLDTVYERELECSKMVPDYNVNMTKGPADCERDGGRERLGHVFQGRPPYGYETVPPKKKQLSDEDKLLIEECRKLGFEIPPDSLDEWKKKLKSDEEYEHDEDNRNRQAQSNTSSNASSAEHEKKEPEEEKEPPKPCKDHPVNVRCMKCMNSSSGPKIRRLNGTIHGFKFEN